jgi:hypothetical protein
MEQGGQADQEEPHGREWAMRLLLLHHHIITIIIMMMDLLLLISRTHICDLAR